MLHTIHDATCTCVCIHVFRMLLVRVDYLNTCYNPQLIQLRTAVHSLYKSGMLSVQRSGTHTHAHAMPKTAAESTTASWQSAWQMVDPLPLGVRELQSRTNTTAGFTILFITSESTSTRKFLVEDRKKARSETAAIAHGCSTA